MTEYATIYEPGGKIYELDADLVTLVNNTSWGRVFDTYAPEFDHEGGSVLVVNIAHVQAVGVTKQ